MVQVTYNQAHQKLLKLLGNSTNNNYIWCPHFYPAMYVKKEQNIFTFLKKLTEYKQTLKLHPVKVLALILDYLTSKRIKLQENCDFILQLKNGLKLFNLQEKQVKKVFIDESILSSVKKEVALRKKLQKTPFFATILADKLSKKPYSYTETLCTGRTIPYKGITNYLALATQVLTIFQPLYKDTKTVTVETYLKQITQRIEKTLTQSETLRSKHEEITSFVNQVKKSLKFPNKKITLVRTHGDFIIPNVTIIKGKIILLDWDLSDYRSTFFDVWTFYFNTHFHYNTYSLSKKELSLLFKLKYKNTKNDKNYLLLFMLERLLLILENKGYNYEERIRKRLNNWIGMYEETLLHFNS
tara:strand:+ start:1340 stop:2404 length:1065 start_codon:yes stop_codon:yes gene_type:complete